QQQRLPARQDHRALDRDEPPHRDPSAENRARHRQDFRRSRDGRSALEVDDEHHADTGRDDPSHRHLRAPFRSKGRRFARIGDRFLWHGDRAARLRADFMARRRDRHSAEPGRAGRGQEAAAEGSAARGGAAGAGVAARNRSERSDAAAMSELHAHLRARGFTLLEVLVAVVIFGIISVLAYGGFNQLSQQSGIIETSATRTRAIQSTVQRMAEDFAMLEPRPVREPLGETLEPALRAGGTRTDTLLDLTRSGWTNPAGLTRSTLQRVTYRVVDDKLERAYWNALDRTMTTEPTTAVMIDKVKTASFRFMDQNQTWHEQWPPLGYSGPDAVRLRPIAVEVTLELEDWGKLVRLLEVSG